MTNDHAAVIADLTRRWPEHKLVPTLGRIQAFCDLLGNPQDAYPVIQIAGTNGKGSTAVIVEALLRAQGLRVGRFASPHLQEIGERICIDGRPLPAEQFDALYEQLKPLADMVDGQSIDGVAMTFFEFLTGMAYAAFADAPVDVAVMEVGMGGTWDSTNVVDADVAVICPVDIDHAHILGDTIEKIAGEKAGIIKPGCIAVLAGQQPDAAKVLSARCVEQGVEAWREGVEFALLDRQPAVGGQVIRIQTVEGPIGDLHLPVFGAHFAHNAALAVAAVEAFQGGRALPAELIQAGFDDVVLPGRLELVRTAPPVLLDCGHNPHAARATALAVAESFDFRPLIGIVAVMRDKDIRGVLEAYETVMDFIVCTQCATFDRCMSAEELAVVAREVFGPERVSVEPQMDVAIDHAVMLADAAETDAGGVLFAGSVVAAGEARTLLIGHPDADGRDA